MAQPPRPRLIDAARRAEEIAEISRALAEKGFYVLGLVPTIEASPDADILPAEPEQSGPAEATG